MKYLDNTNKLYCKSGLYPCYGTEVSTYMGVTSSGIILAGNIGYEIISNKEGNPIGGISLEGAIFACKSLGNGYHLITNNEWMTIARNIESVSDNWSSGIVGKGGIYRGISNEIASGTSLGCTFTGNGIIGGSGFVAPAGEDFIGLNYNRENDCQKKRQLLLNNYQIIRDFAGNVWELVNIYNNTDGSKYVPIINQICNGGENIYSWDGNDGKSGGICNFINGFVYEKFGPKLSNLNYNNGMGTINMFLSGSKLFRRGGDFGDFSGIYSISTNCGGGACRNIGFRCAYIKAN